MKSTNTKKVLKPAVRRTLVVIEMLLAMIVVSVNDFNVEGFAIWISMIALFLLIGAFLETYSPERVTVKKEVR